MEQRPQVVDERELYFQIYGAYPPDELDEEALTFAVTDNRGHYRVPASLDERQVIEAEASVVNELLMNRIQETKEHRGEQ